MIGCLSAGRIFTPARFYGSWGARDKNDEDEEDSRFWSILHGPKRKELYRKIFPWDEKRRRWRPDPKAMDEAVKSGNYPEFCDLDYLLHLWSLWFQPQFLPHLKECSAGIAIEAMVPSDCFLYPPSEFDLIDPSDSITLSGYDQPDIPDWKRVKLTERSMAVLGPIIEDVERFCMPPNHGEITKEIYVNFVYKRLDISLKIKESGVPYRFTFVAAAPYRIRL